MTEVTCQNARYNSPGITKLLSNQEMALVYLGVPFVLLFIYFLPMELRAQYFTLYLDHPMILSLITNAYNHSTASHLTTNLIYYLVGISTILVLETKISRFKTIVPVMFFIIPLVASAATIVFLSSAGYTQLVGFSGVVAGLVGYLILLVVEKMYSVTPMNKPGAKMAWLLVSAVIITATAASLGVVAVYQVGHLSNGVGHLVGYVIGLVLGYVFR